MYKIISWNVNGIRSIIQKGFEKFLDYESPNITCLQEIKAQHKDWPKKILGKEDFLLYINPAIKKGYSGTATFCKTEPKKIITEIGIDKFDSEGRTQILEFKNDLVVINSYIPNGQRDHKRVPFKLEYCAAMLKIIQKYQKNKKKIIWCGDFNTAHFEIDIARPKSNVNSTGFLPIERAFHDELLKNKMLDVFRTMHPDQKDAYTWWTYMFNCREKNIGWRIDYFFASLNIKKNIVSCDHLDFVMGSDHCPVRMELNLKT